MTGFFGKWSKTAASNATADSTVNWQEGQAPSTVNDSARAMMAAAASYRDDVSGALVCGGTSTAYTLTTNQAFASLADMDGQEIAFVITPTNGDAATLNVNSLGAKALVFSVGNAMPAGSMLDGSVYRATYVNASNCWKVHSPAIANPYNIPLAGGMDYWGTTVPNANFAFPIGQAISRTTYAGLFAIMGTTYGVGDGSTTFNLPDKRERVSAMKTSAASRLSATYFGGDSTAMGAVGGQDNRALVTANLPPYTPSGSVGNSVFTLYFRNGTGGASAQVVDTIENASVGGVNQTRAFTVPGGALTMNAQGGTSTAFSDVQPTIICNYILRIL